MKFLIQHQGIALAIVLTSALLAVAGCGGDDEESSASNGTTATSNGTTGTSNGTTATSNGTTATSNGTTATSNGTTSVDEDFAVLIRGALFTDDLAEAQGLHDPLAAGGEEAAKAAGDFAHYALLGTTLLGTAENSFMGLDRWGMADGIEGFYGDPRFAEAFGMLFNGQPSLEVFVRKSDWVGWGSVEAGRESGGDYWFVVARGRLASEDAATNRETHNAIAAAGEAPAMAAGDVAHVAFTGLADEREFLAIDVWTSSDNIEAFYSDQGFQEAFGMLFEGQPTVAVYHSTDWYQW